MIKGDTTMVFYKSGEVQLHLDINGDGGYGLVGTAPISDLNKQLPDDVAAALRKAGYTQAVLILDAQESADLASAELAPPQ
jgi:hypothetical protein